jgi:uncharacterized protein Yka (UPF0111/DUF47 family)
MTEIFKIILLLLQWFFGEKLKREQRAREISDLFKKVEKEGDRLSDQIRIELNKRSDVDWNDIDIRNS